MTRSEEKGREDESFNAFIEQFKQTSLSIEPHADLQERTLAMIAMKPSSQSEEVEHHSTPLKRNNHPRRMGFVLASAAAACLIVATLFVAKPWSYDPVEHHSAGVTSAFAETMPVRISGMDADGEQASNLFLPAGEGRIALQFFASFSLSAPSKGACSMNIGGEYVEINRETLHDDPRSESEIEAFNESWGENVPLDSTDENTVAIRIFIDVDEDARQRYYSGNMSTDEKLSFSECAQAKALAQLKETTVSFDDGTGKLSRYRFEGTFEDLRLSAID